MWAVKKGFLDNFSKIAGKNQCRCLFLIKVAGLRPATLLKRDSDTGVFKNTFFYKFLWWLFLNRFSTGAIQSVKRSVSFRISTRYQKIRTRKNSLFAHFYAVIVGKTFVFPTTSILKKHLFWKTYVKDCFCFVGVGRFFVVKF